MNSIPIQVTKENALDFYHAMQLHTAQRRLTYICKLYPEILQMKHQEIAELMGLERETVTRNIGAVKRRLQ